MLLQAGQHAPLFDLLDADVETVSLADFRNRCRVILYFYPKDDTPGCTVEAIEFSDLQDDLTRLETVVLGVSMDDCVSHGSFRDKHGLTIHLLADADGEVCRKYKVLVDKAVDGRPRKGILRSTFVIDKQGVIRSAQYGVNPRGHAAEVLQFVERMEIDANR